MDPNQQPQDSSKPNEPIETTAPQADSPAQAGFSQPNPAPGGDFSANPEPTPAAAPISPQSFGQPVPNASQQAFPSPEVPPVGQPAAAPQGENPGHTLGIVSIVLSVVGLSLIGLILGVVSRNKSKAVGAPTTLGTIGMILGIVLTVLSVLIISFFAIITFAAYGGIQERSKNSQTLADAHTLMKYAEVYNADNGTYPATSADIDTSTISEYTSIIKTTPTETSQIQYVKCDELGAQVLYYDTYDSMVKIVPVGIASSTTPC